MSKQTGPSGQRSMRASAGVLAAVIAVSGVAIVSPAAAATAASNAADAGAATTAAPTISGAPIEWTAGFSFSFAPSFSGSGVSSITFSITAGALPAGMTFDSRTGEVSGQPFAPGNYNATITITDPNGSASLPVTFVVHEAAHVTAPALVAGQPYSYKPEYTLPGSNTPASQFVHYSGDLPPGLTWDDNTGTLSGTPTTSTFPAEQVVLSAFAPGKYQQGLFITFGGSGAAPTLSGTDGGGRVPAATVGTPYTFTPGGTHAPGATFSISAGSLPPGLTLDPATGAVSGTPTTKGSFPSTIKVADGNGSATLPITISVGEVPTLTGNGAAGAVPSGRVGVPYSYTPGGSHTPGAVFGVKSGSLPPGLVVDPTTGVVSGTPTTSGTFAATLGVRDDAGSAELATSFVIAPPAPTLTGDGSAGALPNGVVGKPYLFTPGGTHASDAKFSVSDGTLPAGLTLDPATGEISGIPTTKGSFPSTLKVEDGNGSATLPITVNVGEAPTITGDGSTSGAPAAFRGRPYSFTPGGNHALGATFSVQTGVLPEGLSLDTFTGTVSGTPSRRETAAVTLTVTDGNGTAGLPLTFVVTDPPSLTEPKAPYQWVVGENLTYLLDAEGDSPRFAVTRGALPPGLALDSDGKSVSGVPTKSGTYEATITMTNAFGNARATYTFVIDDPVVITATKAQKGQPFSYTLSHTFPRTKAAADTFVLARGELPPGLSSDASGSRVTGTPTKAGNYVVTYYATAPESQFAALAVTFEVTDGPAPTITGNGTPSATPAGIVGKPYTFTPGGTHEAGAKFSVSAGSLPPGLTLDGESGAVTGTPTAEGTFPATLTVTDANGTTDLRASFVMNAPPTITGPSRVEYSKGIGSVLSLALTAGPDATLSVASGALPPGFRVDRLDDMVVIAGNPRESGTFKPTIRVTDAGGSADHEMTIVITDPVEITLRAATGRPFTHTMPLHDGVERYSLWGIQNGEVLSSGLPPGLTFDGASNTFSGTPTAAGSFTTRVVGGSASKSELVMVTIEVSDPVAPTILGADRAGGTVGRAFVFTPGGTHADGARFTISDGALPAGLTLDASTGRVSGTPTRADSSSATITVTDEFGSANLRVSFSIQNARGGELAFTGATVSAVTWAIGILLLVGGTVILVPLRLARRNRHREG